MPTSTDHIVTLTNAIDASGVELESLRLGTFNWQFVQHLAYDGEKLMNMKKMVTSLSRLELMIDMTVSNSSVQNEAMELAICRDALDKGILGELVAAAPHLENLSITFDQNEDDAYYALKFAALVLDTH